MRFAAIAVLLFATVVAGCGGREQAPLTRLTIVALNQNAGRAVFHLTCTPAGGDLPSPARACAALERRPDLATRPKAYVCFGGPTSWWTISIRGRLAGQPVRTDTSTCWTPQMALIGRLGIARSLEAHLVPRRTEVLIPGTKRTFVPGVLRAADFVDCSSHGHLLEQGVPLEPELAASTGYGGRVTFALLTVVRHRDGSVTASCD